MKYLLTLALASSSLFLSAQIDVFEAARTGNVEAAKAMAEINIDTLKSLNDQDYSPLLLATYHNQLEFVEFLFANRVSCAQEGQTALHGVCYKGYSEMGGLLLDHGANPNAVGTGGMTPLHYAAQFNHIELVRSLMIFGADASIKNDGGMSPLDLAKMLNHTEVVALLSDE